MLGVHYSPQFYKAKTMIEPNAYHLLPDRIYTLISSIFSPLLPVSVMPLKS